MKLDDQLSALSDDEFLGVVERHLEARGYGRPRLKKRLTDDELYDLMVAELQYNARTGHFYWRRCSHKPSRWNARWPGRAAGHSGRDGTIRIKLGGMDLLAHTLAVLWMTGKRPARGYCVDHINGDPADNRWDNLRIATYRQNSVNSKLKCNNTTGYRGVCFDKRAGKYQSSIRIGGRKTALGLYDTAEEAAFVYNFYSDLHHGEFARAN